MRSYFHRLGGLLGGILACLVGGGAVLADTPAGSVAPVRAGSGFQYRHDQVSEKPWSIHVARFSRSRTNFVFRTTLAGETAIGLATVSEQMSRLPRSLGRPLAAVNGDYFVRDGAYRGDPEGLFITQGEVISAPIGKSCFWVDAAGEMHITNVSSSFTFTLPAGDVLPLGLNEERTEDRAVLYSTAMGSSTHAVGGREYILERDGEGPWLPLRAGMDYPARVREVRERGDSPIVPGTLVLSIPRSLERRTVGLARGARLQLSLHTLPDLGGVSTAIGGGPALVRDGRRAAFRAEAVRHPRTALGWSRDDFYLIQVDGRQPNLSVGMTLPELADYLLKLGCIEALNLDGGGSSTLWVDGHVMNNPCEGSERPTGTTLVVILTPDGRSVRTNAPAGPALPPP